MKPALLVSLLFTAALLASEKPVLAQKAPVTFDPVALSRTVQIVSGDDFEGRGPGTPGETKTVDFITKQFIAAGLKPAGADGSWTQPVPLARFEIAGEAKYTLTAGGATKTLVRGEDVVTRTFLPVTRATVANAPLVYVGYGIKAPECGWDDFKGVDLKGKIAVVLINDPDFEAPQVEKSAGCFGGKAMTYYGRWTYKYQEAARQGAVGMLIVHETAGAAYGWATVKNSNSTAAFDIVREDPAKAHPLLEGWIQRDLAVSLFKAAGLDFEAQKRAAQSAAFRPVALAGASFSADYAVSSTRIVSANIVGRIVGASRPTETIIYSGHWDHLGIGLPDAKGDKIYNGAEDNGTGMAALVELAKAYAKAPAPQRSVLFLVLTAEEKGLLGSTYYAAHPLYPLETTAAVINIDALSPAGLARDFTTSGSGKVDLEDRIGALLKSRERYFTSDPEPEKGLYYRSDHFPFALKGVPGISASSGVDLEKGGKAAGMAARDDYTNNRYHQPSDEWNANWDMTGVAADTSLLYTLGRELADSKAWPEWKASAEFKPERDKTAAQRPK